MVEWKRVYFVLQFKGNYVCTLMLCKLLQVIRIVCPAAMFMLIRRAQKVTKTHVKDQVAWNAKATDTNGFTNARLQVEPKAKLVIGSQKTYQHGLCVGD